MLRICNTYSCQCCLWFPFSGKIRLFIYRCHCPNLLNFPTFSHETVVFRLEGLGQYSTSAFGNYSLPLFSTKKLYCTATYLIFEVRVASCFLRSLYLHVHVHVHVQVYTLILYARMKSEPFITGIIVLGGSMFQLQPHRQSTTTALLGYF